MSIIYLKLFTVRPLKQVATKWSELRQVGFKKASKFFRQLKTLSRKEQKKLLRLNTVHYLTEKYSISVIPCWGTRLNGNIAPILLKNNERFLGICYFSSIASVKSLFLNQRRD